MATRPVKSAPAPKRGGMSLQERRAQQVVERTQSAVASPPVRRQGALKPTEIIAPPDDDEEEEEAEFDVDRDESDLPGDVGYDDETDSDEAESEPEPTPVKTRSKARTAAVDEPPPVTRGPLQKGVAVRRGAALPMVASGIPSRARLLTAEDQVMPKLKLGQGLSKAVIARKVEIGNWYITGRDLDLGETVYVIPVDMMKSQSIWKNGVGVICRSFDLVMGQGDPGGLCEGTMEDINDPSLRKEDRGCEYRLWGDDGNGGRIPPPCQLAYNFPVIVAVANEDGDLEGEGSQQFQAMLTLRGTSTGAAKQINSAMQGEDPRWLNSIFELSSSSKTNMRGTFAIAGATWFDSTHEFPKLRAMAERYERVATGTSSFMQQNLEADDRDQD